MIYLIVLASLFVQEEVAFKPKDEFEIKLDLSFKQKTQTYTDDRKTETKTTGMLPYLKLDVRVLKIQPEEIRIKVTRDNRDVVLSKKLTGGIEIKLDVGFTDDIKGGISGYKHEVQFLSAEKVVLSRILIEIDKEGNYVVNGEKRGKL